HNPIEAFESARRVVRGGLVNGGGPFTKDSVYLSGLVDVHHYLRTAIRAGDTKLIRLLFVGKVDLKDLEAMELLLSQNLIMMPQLMPPWATDLRYTLSYLAYSTFLNGINAEKIAPQHKAWLSQ
ncbi:MAG: tyrosine/phenylalanine carboxypeptidase domain-containing protein, partial [Pseudomonadota bacterium]